MNLHRLQQFQEAGVAGCAVATPQIAVLEHEEHRPAKPLGFLDDGGQQLGTGERELFN